MDFLVVAFDYLLDCSHALGFVFGDGAKQFQIGFAHESREVGFVLEVEDVALADIFAAFCGFDSLVCFAVSLFCGTDTDCEGSWFAFGVCHSEWVLSPYK